MAKYWRKVNVRIAMIGAENQTEIDPTMPLRVMGYDGAAYRAQLLDEKPNPCYPVVTLVLYFGNSRWNHPRSLRESLEIPEVLKPYVSDYRINVFEIAWLEEEQVRKFRSDFRIVADYFVQMRKNKDYHPGTERIRHVHEILQLMSVLTRDHRYEEALTNTQEGEVTDMCAVLDKVENMGIEKGIEKGKLMVYFDLVRTGDIPLEKASAKLNMSETEFRQKMIEAEYAEV